MSVIFFDIETGPLGQGEIAAMMPPFNRADVKVGNLGPEKAAQKIMEAETSYWSDFYEKAALDPLTGQVLAIGLVYADSGEFVILGPERDEARTLRDFWQICRAEMGRINQMVGFNSHLFDLPFLIRRSWKHRIQIPAGVRRGRYWGEQIVDLREYWQLGDRQARGSLGSIGLHLGVGGKNGDGKDFARLWDEDPLAASQYLRNDLELTVKVAEAMGMLV